MSIFFLLFSFLSFAANGDKEIIEVGITRGEVTRVVEALLWERATHGVNVYLQGDVSDLSVEERERIERIALNKYYDLETYTGRKIAQKMEITGAKLSSKVIK